MRLSLFLLFICLLANTIPAQAQKVLQLEKKNSAKTKKYYIGSELTYRLADDKTWYTDVIMDLFPEEGIIQFSRRLVKPTDIVAIKSYKNRNLAINVERGMYTFGASWMFFSLGATLFGTPITFAAVIVTGSAVVFGWLFRKIFNSRKYKIGKKRKFRILDLTPMVPIGSP
ncbi:MAG: hypothetical protein AB8G15_10865 [Saprospiraceae bacterium]